MKIACIGDVHVKTDNIPEIKVFQDKLLLLLRKEKPNYIVILGDVLHTHEHLHTLPLNTAYEFVSAVRKIAYTYVMVGNHDMINNSQFLSENHWMNGLKEWDNVEIVDKVVCSEDFMLVPYVPNGRFIEALKTHSKDFKTVSLIFAHQEFKGVNMGAIISEHGDEWKDEYPLVISGHIHNHQTVGTNIYYTGSSLQNAFGESEHNYVCFVEYRTTPSFESITKYDLGMPRKQIVYIDIDDVDDLKVEPQANLTKISISGGYEEFKAFRKTKKYKDITDSGAKVIFKPKRIEKVEKREEIQNLKKEGGTDFHSILKQLVDNENSEVLTEFYEKLITDR